MKVSGRVCVLASKSSTEIMGVEIFTLIEDFVMIIVLNSYKDVIHEHL